MSNVEIVGDQNNPTSLLTTTKGGDVIDLQNLPGHKKMHLIQSGEMDMDQFVTPPNMPGHKLKKLRDEHRLKMMEHMKTFKLGDMQNGQGEKEEEEKIEDRGQHVVGDFVMFKKKSYEVLKTRDDAVLLNIKTKGSEELQNVWVPKDKVKKG